MSPGKKTLQTLSLNRNSETLGRGVAKATKKKKSFFFFSPWQIYFAITAPVINFTGNFYTWLVSLSGALFSLPPLLSWGVMAVNSGAQLAGVKKELLVSCKSEESPDPVFTPWSWPADALFWPRWHILLENTLQKYPYCKVIWREYWFSQLHQYILQLRMLKYFS